MKKAEMGWAERGVRRLAPGAGLGALLATAGGVYAAVSGRSVLPVIVTLGEWVAAVFFIAPLVAFMLNIARSAHGQQTAEHRFATVASGVGWAALVLFAMALATRAIFGLGWKPF